MWGMREYIIVAIYENKLKFILLIGFLAIFILYYQGQNYIISHQEQNFIKYIFSRMPVRKTLTVKSIKKF